jgi:hypothetical protein
MEYYMRRETNLSSLSIKEAKESSFSDNGGSSLESKKLDGGSPEDRLERMRRQGIMGMPLLASSLSRSESNESKGTETLELTCFQKTPEVDEVVSSNVGPLELSRSQELEGIGEASPSQRFNTLEQIEVDKSKQEKVDFQSLNDEAGKKSKISEDTANKKRNSSEDTANKKRKSSAGAVNKKRKSSAGAVNKKRKSSADADNKKHKSSVDVANKKRKSSAGAVNKKRKSSADATNEEYNLSIDAADGNGNGSKGTDRMSLVEDPTMVSQSRLQEIKISDNCYKNGEEGKETQGKAEMLRESRLGQARSWRKPARDRVRQVHDWALQVYDRALQESSKVWQKLPPRETVFRNVGAAVVLGLLTTSLLVPRQTDSFVPELSWKGCPPRKYLRDQKSSVAVPYRRAVGTSRDVPALQAGFSVGTPSFRGKADGVPESLSEPTNFGNVPALPKRMKSLSVPADQPNTGRDERFFEVAALSRYRALYSVQLDVIKKLEMEKIDLDADNKWLQYQNQALERVNKRLQDQIQTQEGTIQELQELAQTQQETIQELQKLTQNQQETIQELQKRTPHE